MGKIPRRILISCNEVTNFWFASSKEQIARRRCFSSDATSHETAPKTTTWTRPANVKSKICGVASKNQSKTRTDSSAAQTPARAPAHRDETMTAAINNTSRLWISIREIGKVRRVAIATVPSTIHVARNQECIKPSDRTEGPRTANCLKIVHYRHGRKSMRVIASNG